MPSVLQPDIIARIHALGGDAAGMTGVSLADDLYAIRFGRVLHFMPDDDDEPFYDFYGSYQAHDAWARSDANAFIEHAISAYYVPADDEKTTVGQLFWRGFMFTPVTAGTSDYYDEWADDFAQMDLSACMSVTDGAPPAFIIIAYSYGYPDHYFICANDTNPADPTVFSTDHEVYFDEITYEGTLSEFLARLMSIDESRAVMAQFLTRQNDK